MVGLVTGASSGIGAATARGCCGGRCVAADERLRLANLPRGRISSKHPG
jgi:NAD(P)-dependent dehydrogenase (short-subunit alcohol dehydrogenase family)